MQNLNAFLSAVTTDLRDKVRDQATEFVEDCVSDVTDFVRESETLLQEWTTKLAAGKMTAAGFRRAVRGRVAVAQMRLLTQRGLTRIHMDQLMDMVTESVVSAAFSILPG